MYHFFLGISLPGKHLKKITQDVTLEFDVTVKSSEHNLNVQQ